MSKIVHHRATRGIGGAAAEVGIPAAVGAGANMLASFAAEKSDKFRSTWWAEPALLVALSLLGGKIPMANKVLTPANRRALAMVAGYTGKIHWDLKQYSEGKRQTPPWPLSFSPAASTTRGLQGGGVEMAALQGGNVGAAFMGQDNALSFT